MPANFDVLARRMIADVELYLSLVASDPGYFVARDAASRIVRVSRGVS